MRLKENLTDRSRSSQWWDRAHDPPGDLSALTHSIMIARGHQSRLLGRPGCINGRRWHKKRSLRNSHLFLKRPSCGSKAITGFRAFIRSVERADWCLWPLRVDAGDKTGIQAGRPGSAGRLGASAWRVCPPAVLLAVSQEFTPLFYPVSIFPG